MANSGTGANLQPTISEAASGDGSLQLDNHSLFRALPQQAHFYRQPSQTAKPIVQHGGNYAVWTDNHIALLTEDGGEPSLRVKHMYLDSWISKNIRVMACTGFVRAKEENTCKKCGYTVDMHRDADEVKERKGWRNKHIGTAVCNTYGVLDFQGIGVVNQAPYCRLSPTSNAATVHRLLLYHWKLPTPTLIISVLEGTGDFELQPKVKQAIKNGLVKAAETTGAWIITNGLNCGASKEVGSALKNAFKRNNRIPCIGITPWGIVQGRENLIGPDQKVRYYSRKAEVGKLNAHHSHFLLADNGLFTCKGAEVRLRRNLERYLSGRQPAHQSSKLGNPNRKSVQEHSLRSGSDNAVLPDITTHFEDPSSVKDNDSPATDESGQQQSACKVDDSPKLLDAVVAKLPEALAPKIPLVCVAIEGGVSLIRTMVDYLSEDPPVPIVVCDGTGKAADIISFAHRVYDERTRSIPDSVRAELAQTMHLTFNIASEEANNLIKELELCFHLRQDYISIYSYGGSQGGGGGGDGVGDVDVKILSALLHSHTASPLERFHLTMSWGRPDLAENEIFRVGKSHPTEWSVSEVSDALMSAFCQDRVAFVKLLLHNGVDVQKFLTFRALEQLYNSSRTTPNSMLAKLLKEVKRTKRYAPLRDESKSQTEDSNTVSLIDIGSIIELLIGGVYRSAYCRKLFKIKYREYKAIEEGQSQNINNKKKNSNKATVPEKLPVPGLKLRRVSTRLIANASFKSLTEQVKQLDDIQQDEEKDGKAVKEVEPTEYIFEFPFHELFLWAVLAERHEMAKFLWEQSPEPLAKAITGAKMYFSMSEEAEKDDSDLGSAESLKKNGEEFLELAVSLIDECYNIDTCQTGHLLTYELQQWSKQTNLSMAVHAGAKTFVSHNSCQSLINDLWMGGLKSNKNSNFKVIACILCFPLLFLMEYKTVEELRLMPQTAEEHAEQDPEHYDSDSTSTTSTSSSSSSENGFSTAAEDGVGEHRVWGRLKRLKRRRHKSTTSATTQSHPAHLNHEHSHHPQQQNQIVLQSVKNDGTVATDSLSVSNGKIIHNKTSATVSNRVPLDVASNLEEHFLSSSSGKDNMHDVPVVMSKASSRVKINALGTIIKENNGVGVAGDGKSVVSWNGRGSSNRQITMMKKLYEFLNAPIVKFWIHTMAFFVFLTFYHWMILVRLPVKPHWTELYVIAWVLSMCMEVCREIVVSEPVKFRAKVSVWLSDPWNIIDFLGCLLFLVAMGLRFYPATMAWGRWLYCLDVIFWYAKLLEVFSVNKSLGPFVQIIAQMMMDMISFMVFMFLVLTCYGTVRQSILNPNEPFRWENIRDIFFHPYFMIYGEVYAAEIAPECGTEHSPECVTGHWIEPALMSVYLLVENILLVNLLIAVFNNTYNQVRSVTKEVWKYQRYYVIMHHETKPFVPPPLTIFAYISILGRWLVKRHKLHAYDKGLKLFLSREEEMELNKFEERCLANFLRKREHHARQSKEERIRLIDERTEAASSNFVDVNEKVTANRAALQGLELQLEELNRVTNEKLDVMYAMMQTITTHFQNSNVGNTPGGGGYLANNETGEGDGDLADRTLSKEPSRTIAQGSNIDMQTQMDYPDDSGLNHHNQAAYQSHTDSASIQRQVSQPVYMRRMSQPFNRMLSVNVGLSSSMNNPLMASQSISNSGLFLNQSCPPSQAFSLALRNAVVFRERDYTSITDHIESHHLLVNNQNSNTSLVANKDDDYYVEQNAEATQWLAVTHFIRKKLRTYSSKESRKKAKIRKRKKAAAAAVAMVDSPVVKIEIGVASDEEDCGNGNNNNNYSEGKGGHGQKLRGSIMDGRDIDLDYDEEVDNYDDDEPFDDDDDDFGFDLYDEEDLYDDEDGNMLNGSSEVSMDDVGDKVSIKGGSSEVVVKVSTEGRDGEEGSDHEEFTLSQLLSSNSTTLLQRAFKDQMGSVSQTKPRSSNSHHRSSTSSNDTAPRSPNANLLMQGDTFELVDAANVTGAVPVGLASRSNAPGLGCLVEENSSTSV
ncbi:transient receptor potential cation channel subfamily M member 1-like isoform X3 [Convolutriloba macropyga]|uniref:transient receptor potential cation channel subfamily M member 1-like isoform X3 n=1 Tax=Convolutriloba macropyga TaxID=536237 RepID=UPI003F51D64D